MWLAVAGVATLLTSNPAVFSLVQYAGAIYLAYLGVRMILAKPGDAPILHTPLPPFSRPPLPPPPQAPCPFSSTWPPAFVVPSGPRGRGPGRVGPLASPSLPPRRFSFFFSSSPTWPGRGGVEPAPPCARWLKKLAGPRALGFGGKRAIGK